MQIPKRREQKYYRNVATKKVHKIDRRVFTLNLGFSYLNMAMVTLFQIPIPQKLLRNNGVLEENYLNLLVNLVQNQIKHQLYIVNETLTTNNQTDGIVVKINPRKLQLIRKNLMGVILIGQWVLRIEGIFTGALAQSS